MNWRRLEILITASFGVATVLALTLVSVNTWAPEESVVRRIASDANIGFLDKLGGVSGGLVALVFITVLGGSIIMTLLLRGFEKLAEIREERKRIREEARAEGLAEGLAEGRAEGRTEGRAEGRTEGRAQAIAESNQAWEAWVKRLIEEGKIPPDVDFPYSNGASEHPGE